MFNVETWDGYKKSNKIQKVKNEWPLSAWHPRCFEVEHVLGCRIDRIEAMHLPMATATRPSHIMTLWTAMFRLDAIQSEVLPTLHRQPLNELGRVDLPVSKVTPVV